MEAIGAAASMNLALHHARGQLHQDPSASPCSSHFSRRNAIRLSNKGSETRFAGYRPSSTIWRTAPLAAGVVAPEGSYPWEHPITRAHAEARNATAAIEIALAASNSKQNTPAAACASCLDFFICRPLTGMQLRGAEHDLKKWLERVAPVAPQPTPVS
jgi:hypothetical protein